MKTVKQRTVRKTSKRAGTRASAVGRAKLGKRPARPGSAAESVPAYIAALPPAHRALAKRFDTLVGKVIPEVERAIKWGLPFYGIEGRGWFVSCGVVRGEVRITFFQGRKLRPVPPEGGEQLRGMRLEGPESFGARQIESWVRQAAKLPGFGA